MEKVSIPNEYFLKSVEKSYADYKIAIFRELLQNSVDAGSTVIRLSVTEEGYVCEDNGRGMSKEKMVEALLTMGGSFKEEGSTGGFGEAKILILFAMKNYEIHSNETKAVGEVLDYKFVDCEKIKGTIVKATFPEKIWISSLEEKIEKFVSHCNFSPRVYLNGKLLKKCKKEKEIGDKDWCRIFSTNDKENNSSFVRKNGIVMFETYSSVPNKNIYFELKENSTDVLTSNRDSLNYKHSSQLAEIIKELSINGSSFGLQFGRESIYKGLNPWSQTFEMKVADLKNKINGTNSKWTVEEVLTKIPNISSKDDLDEKLDEYSYLSDDIKKDIEEIFISFHGKNLESDFIVIPPIDNKFKIPKKMSPGNLSKKYENLAKVWKYFIKYISVTIGNHELYRLGWNFGDVEASRSTNGIISTYAVNPTKFNFELTEKFFYTILLLASHEITHHKHRYHDESFSSHNHGILLKSLTAGKTMQEHMRDFSKEKI